MTPKYQSTRGNAPEVSFGSALLQGLAPDGGLYVPTDIPSISSRAWQQAPSFQDLAVTILESWLSDDFSAADGARHVRDALNFDVPLVPLRNRHPDYENTYVLELFHGPTLSFKDFGARTMARLMAAILEERGESLTILVATSGDTGSAVADGFAGLDAIDVVLLYPKGKVSDVQERQLIVERPGVQVYAVEGTFDDCQRMVKGAFVDEELQQLNLSSANSINIGRLLPQMLYYIWAVARLEGESTYFCVPSGNLGNLTGGVMAALSGLPIERFIAAHNANDFFPRFLDGRREEFKTSVRTLSNAMDVGAPSNFERLTHFWSKEELNQHIWATSVTDPETRTRMKAVHEATGYVACPHTSVGLEAAHRFRQTTDDGHPLVVLATAHPAKFPGTVAETLGIEAPTAGALERLNDQPTRYTALPPTLDALREELLAV